MPRYGLMASSRTAPVAMSSSPEILTTRTTSSSLKSTDRGEDVVAPISTGPVLGAIRWTDIGAFHYGSATGVSGSELLNRNQSTSSNTRPEMRGPADAFGVSWVPRRSRTADRKAWPRTWQAALLRPHCSRIGRNQLSAAMCSMLEPSGGPDRLISTTRAGKGTPSRKERARARSDPRSGDGVDGHTNQCSGEQARLGARHGNQNRPQGVVGSGDATDHQADQGHGECREKHERSLLIELHLFMAINYEGDVAREMRSLPVPTPSHPVTHSGSIVQPLSGMSPIQRWIAARERHGLHASAATANEVPAPSLIRS